MNIRSSVLLCKEVIIRVADPFTKSSIQTMGSDFSRFAKALFPALFGLRETDSFHVLKCIQKAFWSHGSFLGGSDKHVSLQKPVAAAGVLLASIVNICYTVNEQRYMALKCKKVFRSIKEADQVEVVDGIKYQGGRQS